MNQVTDQSKKKQNRQFAQQILKKEPVDHFALSSSPDYYEQNISNYVL